MHCTVDCINFQRYAERNLKGMTQVLHQKRELLMIELSIHIYIQIGKLP